MAVNRRKMVMGVIVGNRGFFPTISPRPGARKFCARLSSGKHGVVVALTPEESKHGAVETREESRRCAELFKRNRDRIDGVIVTLPNFGEERAIADALRLADLRVPVLVQATPDDPKKMTIAFAPRQFLRQDVGLQQSSAIRHSLFHHHAAYRKSGLAGVCPRPGVVRRGVPRGKRISELASGSHRCAPRRVQYGALQREDIGHEGISIETLDLSEVLGGSIA